MWGKKYSIQDNKLFQIILKLLKGTTGFSFFFFCKTPLTFTKWSVIISLKKARDCWDKQVECPMKKRILAHLMFWINGKVPRFFILVSCRKIPSCSSLKDNVGDVSNNHFFPTDSGQGGQSTRNQRTARDVWQCTSLCADTGSLTLSLIARWNGYTKRLGRD